MKILLKASVALLCVAAVVFFSVRHHAPASAATAQPAKTAPVIVKDHDTQLEAVKAMQDRFLASGIDAALELDDSQTCAAWLKKNNDDFRKLHIKPIKDINCNEHPVQLTVKYDLANGVFAYKLAHDKDFLETLHLLGFTRVVLVNPIVRKHWMWVGTEEDGFSTQFAEDSY